MRVETCEFEGCNKTFTFNTVAEYVVLLTSHVQAKHGGSGSGNTSTSTGAERPDMSGEVSDENWAKFCGRFKTYQMVHKLTGDQTIIQLSEWMKNGTRATMIGAGSAMEVTDTQDRGRGGHGNGDQGEISDQTNIISSISLKQAAPPHSLAEGNNKSVNVIKSHRCGSRLKDGRGGAKLLKELSPRDSNYDVMLGFVMRVMVGAAIAGSNTQSLYHHTFNAVSQRWERAPPGVADAKKPHKSVTVEVDSTACETTFKDFFSNRGYRPRKAMSRGLADSGATVCLAGTKLMESLKLWQSNLARANIKLYGASGDEIKLLGVAPVVITDRESGGSQGS